MENFMETLLTFLAGNPKLAVLFTVMVVARAVFKPACSVIQAYVDATPSQSDNEKWQKVRDHKAFKAVAYVMDLLLSIKIPQKKSPDSK